MDSLSIAILTLALSGPAAEQLPSEAVREWSDASGSKRAQAVLVSIDGDAIWLRRSDGKRVSARLANLSQRDQLYVSTQQRRAAAISAASTTAAAVERAAETLKPLQKLSGWTASNHSEIERPPAPAALVYVRVSRRFLEQFVERHIRQRKPVVDCVLGARIEGESETHGHTRLALVPATGRLVGEIEFLGTVQAHTRGYKGPVVLHNVSDTSFTARKQIAMDDTGFRAAPATISGPTQLQTIDIDTSLPRLRGRIAERVAWRHVESSHNQAEAITGDHTTTDVRRDFDARVNKSIAKVQSVLGEKIPDLEAGTYTVPTDVRFRSNVDSVEMAILRRDATADDRKLRPPPADADFDLSLRVHRTLFTSAIKDPQLIQDLAPLLMKLLQARADFVAKNKNQSTSKPTVDTDAKWSTDLEWLSLDFKEST